MAGVLIVRAGRVLSDGGEWTADVLVDGDRIVDVATGIDAAGTEVVDASGCYIAPGFIDLQLNGAFGVDLTTTPGEVARVTAGLPEYGVTAYCPTVISCSPARRATAIETINGTAAITGGARPLGLHLEGPMLNPVRRGAHPARALVEAAPDLVAGWTREAGIALVTLAPELPGALDVIRRLVAEEVVVSAGHSDATAEELAAAVDAGITYVTHLFNAMRPFAHRDPGIVGAALADERVTCGLIADGIHVHPTAVRMAWKALGPDRLNLVTDAVAVLGAPGRRAVVGDVELVATEHGVRDSGGALAGTDLSLDQAVRNLVAWTGCPPAQAIATVTSTPARVLGLTTKGSVRVGADADLVVLDAGLRPRWVMAGGVVAAANMGR